jgi:hypothetical protein
MVNIEPVRRWNEAWKHKFVRLEIGAGKLYSIQCSAQCLRSNKQRLKSVHTVSHLDAVYLPPCNWKEQAHRSSSSHGGGMPNRAMIFLFELARFASY